MNEKLKKLAEQAGFQYIKDEGIGWAGNYNSSLPKFAEAIVKECVNIAYEYDKPKLSGPGLAIASNIESHFDIYIEEDGSL